MYVLNRNKPNGVTVEPFDTTRDALEFENSGYPLGQILRERRILGVLFDSDMKGSA